MTHKARIAAGLVVCGTGDWLSALRASSRSILLHAHLRLLGLVFEDQVFQHSLRSLTSSSSNGCNASNCRRNVSPGPRSSSSNYSVSALTAIVSDSLLSKSTWAAWAKPIASKIISDTYHSLEAGQIQLRVRAFRDDMPLMDKDDVSKTQS